MPYTFPHQKVITINREAAKSDFLGIKNENWQSAARDLGAHSLMLYLYLASNANGYHLALSPTAITNTIGMPVSTYRDQLKKLINKGYIVNTSGNNYDFYEVPQTDAVVNTQNIQLCKTPTVLNFEECTNTDTVITRDVRNISPNITEINNTEFPINNKETNNSESNGIADIYIPKVREIKIPIPEVERKKGTFKF